MVTATLMVTTGRAATAEGDVPATIVVVLCTGVRAATIQFDRSHMFSAQQCSVADSDPRLWFNGPTGVLYVDAPVPDALGFLADCTDDLRRLHAPADIASSAAMSSLRKLAERLENHEYAPMVGPIVGLEIITARLEEHDIPFHIDASSAKARVYPRLILVRLGPSWIACESAQVDERRDSLK